MYAFLLTEAWGCRDFVLSTRIEQAFDATKDGRKQIHRLIGQNSHEDVVRHLAAECAASSMQRLLRVHSHRTTFWVVQVLALLYMLLATFWVRPGDLL